MGADLVERFDRGEVRHEDMPDEASAAWLRMREERGEQLEARWRAREDRAGDVWERSGRVKIVLRPNREDGQLFAVLDPQYPHYRAHETSGLLAAHGWQKIARGIRGGEMFGLRRDEALAMCGAARKDVAERLGE